MPLCLIVDCDSMDFVFCLSEGHFLNKKNAPLICERLKFQNFLTWYKGLLIWLINPQWWSHQPLPSLKKNSYVHPDVEFVKYFSPAQLTYFTKVSLVSQIPRLLCKHHSSKTRNLFNWFICKTTFSSTMCKILCWKRVAPPEQNDCAK